MKHILYDVGFYFLWFLRMILEAILNSLNNVSRGEQRGGGVIIGENILLVYFMFRSIKVILKQYKISREKTGNSLVRFFFFRKASLTCEKFTVEYLPRLCQEAQKTGLLTNFEVRIWFSIWSFLVSENINHFEAIEKSHKKNRQEMVESPTPLLIL